MRPQVCSPCVSCHCVHAEGQRRRNKGQSTPSVQAGAASRTPRSTSLRTTKQQQQQQQQQQVRFPDILVVGRVYSSC